MKIFITVTILFSFFSGPKSFYDLSVKNIDGNIINMNDFRNKKIVVVILSNDPADSATLQTLNSLSRQYTDSFMVIGVPSTETNSSVDQTVLRNYYRSFLGSQLIITESMYTTRTSGQQSELFEWLTHKDKNSHFDMDPEGPGTKYYIDGRGELEAVFSPGIPLSEKIINKMILNN